MASRKSAHKPNDPYPESSTSAGNGGVSLDGLTDGAAASLGRSFVADERDILRLETQLASSVRTSAALREQARHLAEQTVIERTRSQLAQNDYEKMKTQAHLSAQLGAVDTQRLSRALQVANGRIAVLSSPLTIARDVVHLARVQDAVRRTKLSVFQLREIVLGAAADMAAWQRDEMANLAKLQRALPARVSAIMVARPAAIMSSFSAWLPVGADNLADPEPTAMADPRVTSLLRERTDLKARLAALQSELLAEKAARSACEARILSMEAGARESVPSSVVFELGQSLARADMEAMHGREGEAQQAAQRTSLSETNALQEALRRKSAEVAVLQAELSSALGQIEQGTGTGAGAQPSGLDRSSAERDTALAVLREQQAQEISSMRSMYEARAGEMAASAQANAEAMQGQLDRLGEVDTLACTERLALDAALEEAMQSLERERVLYDRAVHTERREVAQAAYCPSPAPDFAQAVPIWGNMSKVLSPPRMAPLSRGPPRPVGVGIVGQSTGGSDAECRDGGQEEEEQRQAQANAQLLAPSAASSLRPVLHDVQAQTQGDGAAPLDDPRVTIARLQTGIAVAKAEAVRASAVASVREAAWQHTALHHALEWQGQLVRSQLQVQALRSSLAEQAGAAEEAMSTLHDQLCASRQYAQAVSASLSKSSVAQAHMKEDLTRTGSEVARLQGDAAVMLGALAAKDEAIRQLKSALAPEAAKEWREDTLAAHLQDAQSVIAGLKAQLESTRASASAREKALQAKDIDLMKISAQIPEHVSTLTATLQGQVTRLRDDASAARAHAHGADLALAEWKGRAERAEADAGRVRREAGHLQRLADGGHYVSSGAGRNELTQDTPRMRTLNGTGTPGRHSRALSSSYAGARSPGIVVQQAYPPMTPGSLTSFALASDPNPSLDGAVHLLGAFSPAAIKKRIRARSAVPVNFVPGTRSTFDLAKVPATQPSFPKPALMPLHVAQRFSVHSSEEEGVNVTATGQLGLETTIGTVPLADLRHSGKGIGSFRARTPRTRTAYRSLSSKAASACSVTESYLQEDGAGDGHTGDVSFASQGRSVTPGRVPADVSHKVTGTVRLPRRIAARWSLAAALLHRLSNVADISKTKAAFDALVMHSQSRSLVASRSALFSLESYMLDAHIPSPGLVKEVDAWKVKVDALTAALEDAKACRAADQDALAQARSDMVSAQADAESEKRLKSDALLQLKREVRTLERTREEQQHMTAALGDTEQERAALEGKVEALTGRLRLYEGLESAMERAQVSIKREQVECERLAAIIAQLTGEREYLLGLADVLREGERMEGVTSRSGRALLTGKDLPADFAMIREQALAIGSELRSKSSSIASLEQALASANEAAAVAREGQESAHADASRLRVQVESALAKARETDVLRRELNSAVHALHVAQGERVEAEGVRAAAVAARSKAEERCALLTAEVDQAVSRTATLAAAKAGVEAELISARATMQAGIRGSAPVTVPASFDHVQAMQARKVPSVEPVQQMATVPLPLPVPAGIELDEPKHPAPTDAPACSEVAAQLAMEGGTAGAYAGDVEVLEFRAGLAALRANLDQVNKSLVRSTYGRGTDSVPPGAVPGVPGPVALPVAATTATPARAPPPPPPFSSPFARNPGANRR